MRRYAYRLVATLALVACTGDTAGNPSAPKIDLTTAYLSVSPANPVAGSIVTMTVRAGAGDPTLTSFAGHVLLPPGVSFIRERAAEGAGLQAVRASGDTVLFASANPDGFSSTLYAFDVLVDVPRNVGLARLEMTEAAAAPSDDVAGGATTAGAATTTTWGDITFDGTITTADATAIMSASLGLSVSGNFQVPLGDANCDGNVTAGDALIVLVKSVGTSVSSFCVGTTATVVLSGEIRDAVSFNAISVARMTLNSSGFDAGISLPRSATTDSKGAYVFYNNIPDGTYSFNVIANGYTVANSPSVVISKANPQTIELTLTPGTNSTQFGTVSGRILTSGGTPVGGAVVQLSGGIQTNGPYKATTTATDGSYSFSGVTLTDENKVPIPSFTISAKATTGEVGSLTGVVLKANEVKTGVNVTVAASTAVITSYFTEGFESGIPATWTATGLWTERNNTAIANKAYPTYVKLAPNDPSLGVVPLPMTGVGAAWAGSAASGNFMGTQSTTDASLSGGTGTDEQEGLLLSPDFAVPSGGSHVTLYFDAWFEVESVNPNASGFDIMEVTVTDVGLGETRSLTRLNPFEDPPLSNRSAIPFTSGGFNRNPVWRPVYFNLDAYKGKTINIGFCFRTVDQLYNGFRGWLIDNVRVSDEVAAGPSLPGTAMAGGKVGVGRPARPGKENEAAGFVTSCASSVQDIDVASVTVSPASPSLTITETAQLLATPFDAFGVGLAGRSVSWSSSNTNVATVSNTGLVTGVATGTATISATVDTKIGSTTVTVGTPTSTMAIFAGDNQTAVVGTNVSIQPSVRILNPSGQPVVGASVTFAVASGGGAITGGTQTTNASGVATLTTWTLGTTAGANTVTASSPAATNGPLTFTATGATSGLNLTIENLYITQATQTMANDVPLVAGRPAFVRVFVKAAAANTAKPDVRVRLMQGATEVKSYTITAPGSSAPTTVAEGTIGSSWNLLIPAEDITTGLSIVAEVDPDGAVTETVEDDNTFPKSGTAMALDIRSMPTFNVTFVPVTQPGGVTAAINDGNKDSFIDFARRIYPIGAVDAVVHAPFSYGKTLSSGYDATWSDLLLQLKTLRVAELPAPGTGRFYYGVMHPTYVSGGTGLAYVGDPAAIGIDLTTSVTGMATDLRAQTAAHEWGHNFNRKHVDCGTPANVDASYPYATSVIGANGYDVFKGTFFTQSTKSDIMGYCANQWISDYTYKGVLAYRASTGGGPMVQANAAGRGLLVWGQVGPNGVTLEPSFEVTALPSLPARAGSNNVQALDARGNTIFSLSFEGDEVDHMPGVRHFAYVVPLPQGYAAPSAMRVSDNRRLLRSVSPSSGVIPNEVREPHLARVGSRVRVTWDAAQHPMVMVRDAATGQILSFARGGTAEVTTQRGELEVVLSNGVTSTRKVMKVLPQ